MLFMITQQIEKLHTIIQKGCDDTVFHLEHWNNGKIFMKSYKYGMVNGENILNVLEDIVNFHEADVIDIDSIFDLQELMQHFKIPYTVKDCVTV